MSRVRTNQITNSAGTGAPNFPNGVTVTGVSTVTGGINADNTILVNRTGSTQTAFQATLSGVTKVDIQAGGAAEFTGTVEASRLNIKGTSTENILVGYAAATPTWLITAGGYLSLGNLSGGGNININGSDGSAVFGGTVRSNEGYSVYPPLDSNYAFATRNAANSAWTAFIEANGKATFAGNVVLSTAGTGIDFSATGDGSGTSTSELLDDYEEGTWTPTTTNFTHTVDATECRYTKIGRMVYLTGQISRNQASVPAADIVVITGLPYNQSSVTRSLSGNYWLDNLTTSTDYIGGITYSNNTTNIIFAQASTPTYTASSRYIEGNDFDNNRGILFSLVYITD